MIINSASFSTCTLMVSNSRTIYVSHISFAYTCKGDNPHSKQQVIYAYGGRGDKLKRLDYIRSRRLELMLIFLLLEH